MLISSLFFLSSQYTALGINAVESATSNFPHHNLLEITDESQDPNLTYAVAIAVENSEEG